MNDSEKCANNTDGSSDPTKLNDYVRIENSSRCRDTSVERKLKVIDQMDVSDACCAFPVGDGITYIFSLKTLQMQRSQLSKRKKP